MAERKVSLRVLYTINSSPQYILARSHSPVLVTTIPNIDENPANTSQRPTLYGNVLLNTCLDTICRSSPELTQDCTRDFSVYVLDPLESNNAPAPVHISNGVADASPLTSTTTSEQPRGVAVGLGLMSLARTSEDWDSMTVVGTLVKQGNGQEALEVIFALRETIAVKQPAWNIPSTSCQAPSNLQESASSFSSSQGERKLPQWRSSQPSIARSASTSDLTRETLASIQTRSKPKVKPPKLVRQSTTPITESDKLMNANTYIGPLKKKGRPKISGADPKISAIIHSNAIASGSDSKPTRKGKEIIVIDDSDSDSGAPTSLAAINTSQGSNDTTKTKKHISQHPAIHPFTTNPLVRCQTEPQLVGIQIKPEPKEEPTLLDILAFLSASSSEADGPNAAILAALNAIDSSSSQGVASTADVPNPALIAALQQLLSVCTKPTDPVEAKAASLQHRRSSSSSHGDSIVILEKENVNPVAFKKRVEKDRLDNKFSDPVASSSTAGLSTHVSRSEKAIQSLGPSIRSNEITTKTSLKSSESLPGSERVVRKRTLSDFMDEKESGRSKGKGKERERVERRDSFRHSTLQRPVKPPMTDALRHYPRLLASNTPRVEQPSNYYRTPLEPWTSPVRPPRAENDENKQNTIGESSRPRSSPKQHSPRHQKVSASSPVRGTRAQEARKKYVVPEWARTNTMTMPRLSEEAQRALEDAEERKKQERNAARRRLSSIQGKLKSTSSTSTLKTKHNPSEQHPRQDFLVPRKSDFSRGPIAASSGGPMIAFPLLTSSRSSSPPPNLIVIPKTPKTPTRNRTLPTPGLDGDSLFTPVGKSGSIFGSAYSQYSPHGTPPSILTSPLGNRKKAKMSPMRSLLTGKGLLWGRMGSPKTSSTDSADLEEPKLKSLLGNELEDALEDLDCPPSSLPIASSDIDIDPSHSQSSGDAHQPLNDEDEMTAVKQHWTGLPPSSPPAPSSPMLLPEDPRTDDEMDDLPIATSDNEADTDMDAFDIDVTSPDSNSPDTATDFNEPSLNMTGGGEFSTFFQNSHSPCSKLPSSSTMDLFDQFTNVNTQSDDFQHVGGSSAMNTDFTDLEIIFQNGLEGMDFTEFWETFKPLIADNTQASQNLADQGCMEFFTSSDAQLLGSFGEIDHVKLADDMQTLLSGCVM